MTLALDGALEQERVESLDEIAYMYRIMGESDGYTGTYPQQRDFEYLSGYLMGVYRYRFENPVSREDLDSAPF